LGSVAPSMNRPVLTALRPSQTYQRNIPLKCEHNLNQEVIADQHFKKKLII
jgi:hypothetical protein